MASATFSTSTSSHHAATSPSSPYHDNPLYQLPRVEFNFEDLRTRMTAFTAKFDAFIEKGRKRVLEERNEFKARLSELGEDKKAAQSQISSLGSTLNSHASLLSRENTEKAEILTQISSLESALTTQSSTCARLRAQIAATRRQIEGKEEKQREYGEKMRRQGEMNGPELAFWEEYTGMRIEGSGGDDVITVKFEFEPKSGMVGEEAKREGLFELRVPERGGYEVVHTKPRLEDGSVRRLLERYDQDGEIRGLLKDMRGLFVEVMKG